MIKFYSFTKRLPYLTKCLVFLLSSKILTFHKLVLLFCHENQFDLHF